MNMEDILTNVSDLFVGNGIIIVIGCFVIGTILKGTIKKLPNKYIPYINSVVSVILGFVIPGTYDDENIIAKIIVLIFLGLSSTGMYEAICIIVKDRFSIDLKQIYNNIINKSESSSQTQEDVPQESEDNSSDTEEQ
nr:MAG TPA: holin [Caudoviricetes sp.]